MFFPSLWPEPRPISAVPEVGEGERCDPFYPMLAITQLQQASESDETGLATPLALSI